MKDAQSPREIASKLIVRLGISPEGGERYVGYAEEAIYEAIDADRAARVVTVTDPLRKYADHERPLPPAAPAACYDCARPYGDEHGFPDLVIPHETWERINPTHHRGAGLLCPSCICRRLHAARLENVPGRFTSGPIAEAAPLSDLLARVVEGCARVVDPGDKPPCGCMDPQRTVPWGCDCGDPDDCASEAQYWAEKYKANAVRKRASEIIAAAQAAKGEG